MPRRLLVAFLLALALPASASAGLATLQVRDLPLHGERSLAVASPTSPFQLVGVHWQGPGRLELRIRTASGWSSWRPVREDVEDTPDASSREARAMRGWRLGEPVWVGRGEGLEVRAIGRVTRARALTVRSPVSKVPLRTVAAAGAPRIVPRSGWQADESIVRAKPQYADALRMAFVHHTAGTNGYTRLQAPAILRAIELYHVKGNGWNDIGYNFLVDRFGTVYEGRYGGVDRNVVGAHALGFNRGSVGIAVLGTYIEAAPPTASLDALARLLAWRLDLAHVDPVSTVPVVSGGSERYPSGTPVVLRAVSGHSDTGLTACPGKALYGKLATLAAKAQSIGLPKIYAPLVTGQLGGLVRFQATLSGARPWTVTVADQTGATVASGSGTGPTVDWSWDSAIAVSGAYSWQVAGDGATPATGTLGTAPAEVAALELTEASAEPTTISPNGDGQADSATITYTTTAPATVTVTLVDPNGMDVGPLHGPVDEATGAHTVEFTGEGLSDGLYTIRIDAAGRDTTVARTVSVLVTRTLANVALSPQAFSPNQDGHADRLSVRFTLLGPAAVRVRVLRDGKWVATVFTGDLAAGARVVRWDGSKRLGRLLDGVYTAEVDATDAVGTSSLGLPFAADTRAPTVQILRGRPLRVRVSEPALLTLRVNGRALTVRAVAAGVVRVPWVGPAGRVRVVAWDAAGNVSRPVVRP